MVCQAMFIEDYRHETPFPPGFAHEVLKAAV